MLSPHPRKLSHQRDGHRPGSVVRSVRRSTAIKTKPTFEASEQIPKYDLLSSPVMSMDTTSEEECAGSSFQTEAIVHSECTCHSATDASYVRSCVQHDNTGVTFLEPKTTRASNADLPAGLLAECCATVTVSEPVQTDTKRPGVVVQDGCTMSPELGSVSRSRQYTQCHAINSSHAKPNIEPDNSVGLSEVIGNMLYDISYEMRCDKLNLEDQTSYRGDRIRSDVPDFASMQNDSGVLEDSSPGVKIVENLENSTSDFDLTDGGNAVATDDCSEVCGWYVGGVENSEKVPPEDHLTHDSSTSSVVDTDTMLLAASTNSATTADITTTTTTANTTTLTMDESGRVGSKSDNAEDKYVATEHSCSKVNVSETINMNVGSNQRADSKHMPDGVKLVETREAASVVVVESENVHKTESDAEVVRVDDMKNEAKHEATIETETESAAEIDSENGIVVRNQDGVKHEATISADVENQHTDKTESESDVVIGNKDDTRHGSPHEGVIGVDVERESETNVFEVQQYDESECACTPGSESDIDVTNLNDMKREATIGRGVECEHVCRAENESDVIETKYDTKHEPVIAVCVETESEQTCKTESENCVVVGQHDDVKHERGIAVNDIAVRNQGDTKREATISKGVDSEHVCQTESETDVEIDRQDEACEATIAGYVETENVHACETESENNVSKDAMNHESTMDVEGKPASGINARTESEHIKLQTDESVKSDSGKIVEGEKSYAAVNCVKGIGGKQCDSHDETGLVKELVEDCCTKCSEETNGSSPVEHSQAYKVPVMIDDPCPQGTHGDVDKCHPGLFPGDIRHSEMSDSDFDKKSDICHPVVPPGDSKQELHNDTCRDDNGATVNRNWLHEGNRCVDGTELCQPGVSDEGGGNTLLQTEDRRASDGDKGTQSDVDCPVPRDRPSCDLVNLDLYVQTESDLMLLLLMEDGVTSHEETVTDVVCLYSSSLSLACPVMCGSVA